MKESIKTEKLVENYKILRIQKINQISKIVHDFDNLFMPNLSQRISDLNGFVEKLYNNAIFLAAIEQDDCIGFAAFYANDINMHIAYLTQIAVKSKAQNRHVGKNLLNLCIKTSKSNGMNAIKLEVHNDNTNAVKFYRKNGFEFCGEASVNSKYMIKKL